MQTAIESSPSLLSFDTPFVTHLSPKNAPSSGASVTLSGMNFAAEDLSPTVSFGCSRAQTVSWISDSALRVRAGSGTGSFMSISVRIQSEVAHRAASFSYDEKAVQRSVISSTGIPNVGEPDLISWLLSDSLAGTDGLKWPDSSSLKWDPTIYGRILVSSVASRPVASFTAGYAELDGSVMSAFNGQTDSCADSAFTLFLLAHIGNALPGTSETLLLIHSKFDPDMPQLRLLAVQDSHGVGRLALQTRRGISPFFTAKPLELRVSVA
jgi:hypothetical protein